MLEKYKILILVTVLAFMSAMPFAIAHYLHKDPVSISHKTDKLPACAPIQHKKQH